MGAYHFFIMKTRFIRFMQGRYCTYGTDRLTKFLIALFLVVFLITSFTPPAWDQIFPIVIVVFTYFRMLSRNIPARYRENERYVRQADAVRRRLSVLPARISERKHFHIYRCPSCSQKIRIPRGKGHIMVRCPKCTAEFAKYS